MANYPTQLDEIDQWLADNFGIIPGACSSTENLRHDTARLIAEALWPGNVEEDLEKASHEYECTKSPYGKEAFKAGAKWQKEQDHDACYQCEKNYDNVFFRGEQHAIKMMREEAIEGKCVNVGNAGVVIDTDYGCLYLPPEAFFKVDDMVKIYIFKDE